MSDYWKAKVNKIHLPNNDPVRVSTGKDFILHLLYMYARTPMTPNRLACGWRVLTSPVLCHPVSQILALSGLATS